MSQPSSNPGAEVLDSVSKQSSETKPETKLADQASEIEAAKAKAVRFMNEHQFEQARKALEEAEAIEAAAIRTAQVQSARASAAQYMAEGKFAEAKKALEEAEELEADSDTAGASRILSDIRSRWQKVSLLKPFSKPTGDGSKPDTRPETNETGVGAVDESLRLVRLYSVVGAGVGLLPGGLLNFGAILVVQIAMVWRIANVFGHKEGREHIRGSILSLLGSAVPTVVGHGAGIAVAAIPAIIAGTAIYFIVTPVLAYAMTQAVGKAYVMHFESGGTLLTFDPKAFGEYFLKEFRAAGGTASKEPPATQAA